MELWQQLELSFVLWSNVTSPHPIQCHYLLFSAFLKYSLYIKTIATVCDVLRKEGEYITNDMVTMQVHGKRRTGKHKKGWLDTTIEEMKENNFAGEMAEDRSEVCGT